MMSVQDRPVVLLIVLAKSSAVLWKLSLSPLSKHRNNDNDVGNLVVVELESWISELCRYLVLHARSAIFTYHSLHKATNHRDGRRLNHSLTVGIHSGRRNRGVSA